MKNWFSKLPKEARIAFSIAGACVVAALCIIGGNGAIRSGYLSANDQATFWLPFLAVQLGILGAAIAVSQRHAHSYKRRWRQLIKRIGPAFSKRETTMARLVQLVGVFNGLLDRRKALKAMAGKQLEISSHDVPRQVNMGRHWETLASPEPVETKMFKKAITAAKTRSKTEAREFLAGITDEPTFEAKTVTKINERRIALREEIERLRRERRDLKRTLATKTEVQIGDRTINAEKSDKETIDGNGRVRA